MPRTSIPDSRCSSKRSARSIYPTELPVGPQAALQVARRLMQQNGEENRIVYLVSDFRTKEWDNPASCGNC